MNQPRHASSGGCFRYLFGVALIIVGTALLLQFPTGSLLGLPLLLFGFFCFG